MNEIIVTTPQVTIPEEEYNQLKNAQEPHHSEAVQNITDCEQEMRNMAFQRNVADTFGYVPNFVNINGVYCEYSSIFVVRIRRDTNPSGQ